MYDSRMNRLVAVLLGVALAAAAFGREPTFEEYRAIQDSLHSMPLRMQSRWLAKHGFELPESSSLPSTAPDSVGLRMIGKWGRGPAVEVTGRDSILFLSLGSEVAILNIAEPDSPEVVCEVQAQGLVVNAAVKDSFLYIGCGRGTVGIEVWNIDNMAAPVFRGRASTRLSDFCVQDSFAYVTLRVADTSVDTFKVYSMSDPSNPRLVGWTPDHGDKMAVSGNRVAIADWGDMHVMDVSDPVHPQRAGSVGMGGALGIDIRGNLVCAVKWWNGKSDDFWLDAFDISDAWSPRRLSEIHGVGGYDVHLSGPFVFVSGFYYGWDLQIVDISDSTRPSLISTCGTPGDNTGVWVNWSLDRAYVSDECCGLEVVDISNLNNPVLARTQLLAASLSEDVSFCDTLMYIATWPGAMQIVNVADPTRPLTIAKYDSLGCDLWTSIVVDDSFTFAGDFALRPFCVFDVTDPRHPLLAGRVQPDAFGPAEDMVLRDSFVYCAEARRFQIVNVARPREPVLVGSCVTNDGQYFEVALQDTLAYIAGGGPMQVISVADPASPYVVDTGGRYSMGFALRDSLVYIPWVYDTLFVYSVADPTNFRLLSEVTTSVYPSDVALGESKAYVSSAYGIDIYGLANPVQPVHVGHLNAPDPVIRLGWRDGLLYAILQYSGVAVYETTAVGVQEPSPHASVSMKLNPTVVRGEAWRRLTDSAVVFDAMGRRVTQAKPGVYFLREGLGTRGEGLGKTRKVVLVE